MKEKKVNQKVNRKRNRKAISSLALLVNMAWPILSWSQSSDSVTLENVDEKVRLLERKLELQAEEDDKRKSEAAIVTAGKDGFSIRSADKEDILKLKFFQHVDGRYFFDDGANKLPNTLLLRRIRPIWEGTVSKYYNFRLMPEFSGTFSILDAYGELAFWPEARLRIGKSKTQFGLERLKSSQDMDLIEFAHPTSLTPNYDLGISLLGDFSEEAYSYSIGVFNGAIDGASRDVDFNDDKDIIGRIFALPFKNGDFDLLRNFGLGFAASWGHKEGDLANTETPTYKTEGQPTFFSFRNVADKSSAVTYNATTKVIGNSAAILGDTGTVRAFGDGYRLNPQGYWYFHSFGLSGEYVASVQEYSKGGVKLGSPVLQLTTQAWQATASYVITGESPSFKGLKPRHPLGIDPGDNGKVGLGAWEIVGRYSGLKVDDKAFSEFADPAKSAKEATTWSAGINWYLTRNWKWSAEYAWTEFKGGASANLDRPEEKVFFSRLQASF